MPQASNKSVGHGGRDYQGRGSAQHGGIIHAHRSIWLVLRELANVVSESGDDELSYWVRNSFGVARTLHSNFYEDEADAGDVTAGLLLCEELSERLYELFWPEGPQS